MVAAIVLLIFCGAQNEPFAFLEEELFEAHTDMITMVHQMQAEKRPIYTAAHIIGIGLCILSFCAIFGPFYHTGISHFLLCIAILSAGIEVFLLIWARIQWAGYQKLLQEGDFSVRNKSNKNLFSSIYWPFATACFLLWGFWGSAYIFVRLYVL